MGDSESKFNFEKLQVYGEARSLAVDISKIARAFPAADRVILGGQLQRAAISVASNLAEGSARMGTRDQAHFTNLAYSSLMEVVCQLDLARERGLLSPPQLLSYRDRAWRLARGLSALHESQSKRREARA